MPTWVTAIVAFGAMIFSSGVTWGIFSYRQKHSEDTQTDLVKDLKECVSKLQTVVTEVEVMKAANSRYERQSEEVNKRLTIVEIAVAKLSTVRKR